MLGGRGAGRLPWAVAKSTLYPALSKVSRGPTSSSPQYPYSEMMMRIRFKTEPLLPLLTSDRGRVLCGHGAARASEPAAPVAPGIAEGDAEKIAEWREALSARHAVSAIGPPDPDPESSPGSPLPVTVPSAASPGHGT